MPFCGSCGSRIADNAGFCPNCGRAVGQATGTPPPMSTGGLSDNIAGLLCYVTVIPAVVFLLLSPYNRRRFVRFHAFQSIFLMLACMAASLGLRVLAQLPVLRWSTLLLWPLLGLAELVVWVICVVKAFQGSMFKLPLIGEYAEQQADSGMVDGDMPKAA